MHRRSFLQAGVGIAATLISGWEALGAQPGKSYRRIATEEHFTTPEVIDAFREISGKPSTNLDMEIVVPQYLNPGPMHDELLDLGERRLAVMDKAGIDMQVLSLVSPGVQMFAPDRAIDLAALVNDKIAGTIARHPTRFGGLAAVAPQSPHRAAREMERAINVLKLNGFSIDSHTNNRYLDDPFFWPVLEAAEALDRPIYLHPRMPSDGMAVPFRGLDISVWGYGVEAGTHAVRLIFSGVFDRFPRLRLVLGHMGEALQFWQWRLDDLNAYNRNFLPHSKHLHLTPSEYLKRNFAITTSGQLNPDALVYSLKTLGADHIIWAVDYPYQSSQDAVAFIEHAAIDEATRSMIFSGNATRLFHIRDSRN